MTRKAALVNAPQLVEVPGIATPADRETLSGPEMTTFVRKTADEIANRLGLKRTKQ